MSGFFTRERFGRPQVLASLLLLAFLAQCVWLIGHVPPAPQLDSDAMFRVQQGLREWHGRHIAGTPFEHQEDNEILPPVEVESNGGYDPNHSPLWYLIASAPLLRHSSSIADPVFWVWMERVPYLLFGALLGVSLWYVSRRLYGNAGGYIALALYCFSPAIIRSSSLWMTEAETGAAWGAFGAVFIAIAVAHTLYAPRAVILWNWRRCTLLGLSLLLAVGSQFSLIVIAPVALGFMLYLAPGRRRAAFTIWATACALALFLLYGSYSFHTGVLWAGFRHANFFSFSWRALAMPVAYRQLGSLVLQSGPALAILLVPTFFSFIFWPRTRYFGNTAPLSMAILFIALGLVSPHYPGLGFYLMAVPFLIVFIAGIIADLLETRHRDLIIASVWGLLVANALWNILELSRVNKL